MQTGSFIFASSSALSGASDDGDNCLPACRASAPGMPVVVVTVRYPYAVAVSGMARGTEVTD